MDDLQSLYMSLEGTGLDTGQDSAVVPFVNTFNTLVQMLQRTQPYAFSAETENESPTSVNIALNSYRDESGDWRLIDRSKVAWAIMKDDTTGRISLCYCAADVDPIVWFVVAYADASGIVTSTIFTDPVFDSITIRNDGSKDFITCQRTGGIFPALYTGWGAYIDFTLTYSGVTVPNYVFDFTYDTATLVSAGLLQSDGRDIRFYNATTGEDLDYHIKSGINTSSTLFKIKLDNLSTTVALRMYFSNTSATAASTTSIYTFYDAFSSLTAWTNLDWAGGSDYVIASSTLKKNVDGDGIIVTATPVLLPSTGYCIEATIQTPVTDSLTDIFIGTPARNVWSSPQDFNAMRIKYDGVISAYNAVQRFSWASWTNLDWGSVADTASNEFKFTRDATHNITLYKNNVLDASAVSSTVLDCGTSRYIMVYAWKQNTVIDSIAVYPYITTPPVISSPGAIVYGPQVLSKVDKDGYAVFKRVTLATGETVSDITKDNTLATASDTQLATTLAISGFISSAVSGKADKIIPAVVGNLAGLSSTGNLTDSGFEPADFEAAGAVSGHESAYDHSHYNDAYGWGDHASAGYYIIASNTLDDIADGTTYKLVTAAEKSALHAAGSDDSVTVAEETTDTTCYVNFTTAKSGDLQIKANDALQFNSSTGVLTFSELPILPSEDPTTDYQAASKKYVDDNGGGGGGVPYTGATSDVDLGDHTLTAETLIAFQDCGCSENFIECSKELFEWVPAYNDWGYYKAKTIKAVTGTIPAGYQYYVWVDTSAMVTAGKLESDLDDVRFYDATNAVDLNYEIHQGANTTDTLFFVTLQNELDASTGIELRMYYGNSSATAVSNTDDFRLYIKGDNLTGFTDPTSSYSISSGKITHSGANGNSMLYYDTGLTTASTGYRLECNHQIAGSGKEFGYFCLSPAKDTSTPRNALITGLGDNYYYAARLTTVPSWVGIASYPTISTSEERLLLREDVDNKFEIYRNNATFIDDGTDGTVEDLNTTVYFTIYSYYQGETFRDIYVYDYNKNAPSVAKTDWGEEFAKTSNIQKTLTMNNDGELLDNTTILTGWVNPDETWTASSSTTEIGIPAGGADRYSVGQKIRIKQTTYKYFIIVKVEDTKLTVWGGTDYTVANATIDENHFSMMKAPFGFPMSKEKWKVEASDFSCNPLTDNPPTVVLSRDKKYNLEELSITLGIGEWLIEYIDNPFSNNILSRTCNVLCGLSNDSITRSGSSTATAIQGFTTSRYVTVGGGYEIFEGLSTPSYRNKTVVLTSSATYYPWIQAIWYDGTGTLDDPHELRQGLGDTGVIVRAYLAYL